MALYFLADAHLSPERPDIVAAFRAQLQALPDAEALYLLGDIWNAYLGDDLRGEFENELAAFFDALPYPLYFQAGNRDFLLARQRPFGRLHILPELHFLDLNGRRAALCHGDVFCRRDRAYQRFRRWARHPWTQALYAALPLKYKGKIAQMLRRQSRGKAAAISDVDEDFIAAWVEKQGVQLLIHGHTHRCARHFRPWGERWVLPEWQGGTPLLRWDGRALGWWPPPEALP